MQAQIHGTCSPQFEPVKNAFASLWRDIEVGSGLSVYLEGQNVINLWGGFVDREMTCPFESDALVNVFSSTKGPAALAVAIGVDEGLIAYDHPVVEYWPEFGAHGKNKLTVAQMLSHQAGLCGISSPLTVPDLYNWEKMIGLLETQKPWWPPGTDVGYHAITWGYLVGELIRRVTGVTLGQYLADRISTPLGADFHLGVPNSELHRCIPLIGPNHARRQKPVVTSSTQSQADKSTPLPELNAVALMNPAITPFKDASSQEWRCAEIAASNGHTTADGLARIYAACSLGGTLWGQRIISESVLEQALIPESGNEPDRVLGKPMRKARGFMLNTGGDFGPNDGAFGHDGTGGSLGFADQQHKVSFSYVMNQMQIDSQSPRARLLVDEFYRCLLDS